MLSVKEVAERLKCSSCTVYRHIHDGLLPSYKIGSKDRVSEKDLEDFLNQRRRRTPASLTNSSSPAYCKSRGGQKMSASLKKGRRSLGYGNLYLRGNRWTIDFKDANGKRVQQAVQDAVTYENALFALQQEIAKAFQVRHAPRPGRKTGFSEFSKIFLDDYMMVSRRNYRSDAYRLEALKEFFKDVDLRQITPLQCERLRKARLEKGNSKSTTNRYLALLKRFFTIAIQEGYAEENPVKKIKLFSEKDTLKERILTPEEEEKLLASSSGHLRPILITALNTGARVGEILSLTWERVNLEKREIRFEGCKSGRLRYVPMNQILFDTLTAWKSRNGQSPYVFTNEKTGKPLTTVRRAFVTTRKKASLKDFRIHDCRHSFASRLVQRGCDIVTLQGLLGHRDLTTTQRYLHSTDERRRQAVGLLEKTNPCDGMVTMDKSSSAIH
jgi:excisionase family DNA binding protein